MRSGKIRGVWRRLLIGAVVAGFCGAARAEMSFCSLRCGVGSCADENWPKVLEALSQEPRPFDAVWFSTGVAYPALDWHREQSARCARAAADLKKIGMSASVEIQMTIGHTDAMLERQDCCAQNWPTWVGWDGTVARRASCPRGRTFRDYFARVAAIYAAWKPDCIWIDDDLRIDNRAPSSDRRRHWGCWCGACLGELSRREGRAWTRETLLAAIEGGDKAIEARWLAVQVDGLAELAGMIGKAVVEVSPEVCLGLQAKGHAKILKTLHEVAGRPIRMRPGAGAYWDTNPHVQLQKAYRVTKAAEETGCLDLVDMICPEIESCPRTFSCRTAKGVVLEGFEQLALCANALSMFVADTRAGEDWNFYRDTLFRRIAAAKGFLKGYAEANRGTLPCGFTLKGGEAPQELVACRGVPIVCGRSRSLGELPDVNAIPARLGGAIWQAKGAHETIVMQTASGPSLMAFARQADAVSGGRTPILFTRPVMAWALPRVRENGELRTVAIINCSIDVQDAVRVRLRGVREGARVEWVPLRGERTTLAVTREGDDAVVEVPSVGAWDAGYLLVAGEMSPRMRAQKVGLNAPSGCLSAEVVFDAGPVRVRHPSVFRVDAGKVVSAAGAELTSPVSRWHCSTPAKMSVFVADDPAGETGRREVWKGDDLPPAFAGESLFVDWPKTAARYWFFSFEDGGTRAIVRSGQYVNWAGFKVRNLWGWPNNKDGTFVDDINLTGLRLLSALPPSAPQARRPAAQAYDEPRLLKDWLMRDFGLDRWHEQLDERASRPLARTEVAAAYERAGRPFPWARRQARLAKLAEKVSQIVYVRRKYALGGDAELHGTALVTDEPVTGRPKNFRKGAELCLLTIRPDGTISNEVLLARPEGMIRDPDLSHDGRTLVFSMRDSFNENEYVRARGEIDRKKGEPTRGSGFPYDFYTKLEGDDYHLYTLDLATRALRQITFSDPGRCADFEPCWTSGGEIVFQSSRCEQVIPCHQTMAVNLYACRADGSGVHRLAADGGCTSHPTELPDGRILYTRYEYNDRSARLNQPLFTMNPDGTLQKEFYGNGSAFPTSLIHFRPIPGTSKFLGLVSGHHVHQQGKLVELDPALGMEGDSGLTFVAGADLEEKGVVVKSHYEDDPRMVKPWFPDALDFATQTGAQWQYPYPLDADEFLVSFLPEGTLAIKGSSGPHFGVYWQNRDGDRELLAHDPDWECVQAIPVVKRPKTFARSTFRRDPSAAFGVFDVRNVYESEVLAGVPAGAVKRLRVVAVESRPTYTYSCALRWICDERFKRFIAYKHDHSGEALNAGGAWDVKHVLGEADVAEDGSCTFRCPARNPVYFQLLDAKGRTIQTMRSWTHLEAGEVASCIGCHENKSHAAAPPPLVRTGTRLQDLKPPAGQPAHPLLKRLEAEGGLLASPDNLLGVHGRRSTDPEAPTEGFSYRRLVQPILDRSCVRCHDGTGERAKRPNLTAAVVTNFLPEAHRAFTASYRALTGGGRQTDFSSWYSSGGICEPLPPYAQGSSVSRLMDFFEPSHHGVSVSDDEKRVVACWLDLGIPFGGSYPEATVWTDDDRKAYEYHQNKRLAFAEAEIREERERMRNGQ